MSFDCFAMLPDHFGHQQYALSHWQVGKAYHAGMPGPPDEQKLAEVVVERDEDSAAGAAVDQELHRVSTETAASVSPAITACAYAMQARTSSFSSCG